MTGEAIHVSEEGISTARTHLDDVEILGQQTGAQLSYVNARQDTSKWTSLSEASRSLQATRQRTDELVAAIQQATLVANEFSRLVNETRTAFQNADEEQQSIMLAQLGQLEGTFAAFDPSVPIPPQLRHLLAAIGIFQRAF